VKIIYHCIMELTKEKQTAPNPSNLMSVPDYAKHIGKDRRTVYNMINDGRVKQVEFLGKNWVDV